MRSGRLVPVTGLLCAVLLGARAEAAAPEPFFPSSPRSWLTVSGGGRAIFQSDLSRGLALAGRSLRFHNWLQPAALLGATYAFDPHWAVRAEFGWSPDRYLLDDAVVFVQTYQAQVAVEWMPLSPWGRVLPYLQAGLGYYFSGITEPVSGLDQTSTTSNTGGSLAIGARVALTPSLGLSIEERYALAFSVLGSVGAASVGGNTVLLGMYFVWK